MNTESFFPPTPDVQHLPTLFRRIQQGEIRVPAFQRGFVWKEAQIVQLLESVYRGFPIGSLLFWSVKEPLLRIEKSATFPFPAVVEKYPLKFLLDGLQRLSTLYGVFHWPNTDRSGQYNIIFDLDAEEFRHFEGGLPLRRTIHLSNLFSPKDFLAAQRVLSSEADAEFLMERAIRLHSVFQEYMIPTVTIENRSVSDVVSMFERVNSTGTKLNAVDFMRAVTWSQDFDLNTEINSLSRMLANSSFKIKDETLVKAFAVVAGKAPTPAAMLELRRLPPNALNEAMSGLRVLIEKSRQFLLERFAMRSYEYLPYEGQLLVLIRFIQSDGLQDAAKTRKVEQWLWATSFNEELRGKPDHYVVRMLSRLEELLSGDLQALQSRLTITPEDLLERRFIRGKALSAAFACMFAKRESRSLITGKVVPPELYMEEFSAKNFDGLFEVPSLTETFQREFPSKKMFANTFLLSEEDLLVANVVTGKQLFKMCISVHGEKADEILRSQFVLPHSLNFLEQGDLGSFLATRAAFIVQEAKSLVGGE
jgi:hypothetical protein